MEPNKKLSVDTDFLRRVFNASLFLSLLIFVAMLSSAGGQGLAWGFGVGSVIGLIFFRSLRWAVEMFLRVDSPKKPGFVIKVALVKILFAGLTIYYSFIYLKINPYALVAGLAVVHTVMILKVVGILFINSVNSKLTFQKG